MQCGAGGLRLKAVVSLPVRYEGSYDVSVFAGHGPVTLDRWTIDPAQAWWPRPESTTATRSFPG